MHADHDVELQLSFLQAVVLVQSSTYIILLVHFLVFFFQWLHKWLAFHVPNFAKQSMCSPLFTLAANSCSLFLHELFTCFSNNTVAMATKQGRANFVQPLQRCGYDSFGWVIYTISETINLSKAMWLLQSDWFCSKLMHSTQKPAIVCVWYSTLG